MQKMIWQKVIVEVRMIDRKLFYLYLKEIMTRIVVLEMERMRRLKKIGGLESRGFINRSDEGNERRRKCQRRLPVFWLENSSRWRC